MDEETKNLPQEGEKNIWIDENDSTVLWVRVAGLLAVPLDYKIAVNSLTRLWLLDKLKERFANASAWEMAILLEAVSGAEDYGTGTDQATPSNPRRIAIRGPDGLRFVTVEELLAMNGLNLGSEEKS